ncbi:MAG: hypothetical protein OXL41_14285 [Nitrospinae bacterium]|nr:hypothetical protein [Nitrospinota bacterium]
MRPKKKLLLSSLLAAFGVFLLVLSAQAQSLTPPPLTPPEAQPTAPGTVPGQPQAAPVLAPPAPAMPQQTPLTPTEPQRPLDLIVTITLATGKAETFAREIDRLEIITGSGGTVEMVHLLLVTGGESNTHVWYNYDQVAKLSYRFVNPEGKAKVYVRPLQASPTTMELSDRLQPLSPREFR